MDHVSQINVLGLLSSRFFFQQIMNLKFKKKKSSASMVSFGDQLKHVSHN